MFSFKKIFSHLNKIAIAFLLTHCVLVFANENGNVSLASESPTVSESSKSGNEYSYYFNIRQGKFVFATTEVDAEFNSIMIQRTAFFSNSSIFYNLNFDYMFNTSKVSCVSLLAAVGKKIEVTDSLSIKPSIGYGVTLYREQTSIQNVNSLGNNYFIQSSLDYNIQPNLALSLNLQYNYQTHSRSLTATNNSDEMILKYMTTGIGLTWRP